MAAPGQTIDVHLVLTILTDPHGREQFRVMVDDGAGEFVDATKDYELAAAVSDCGTKHGFTLLRRAEVDPGPIGSEVDEHCGDPLHGYPCTCYLDEVEA